MKKHHVYLITAGLLLCLSSGCSGNDVTVTKTVFSTATNTLDLSSVNETIQVEAGKEFTISLKSNPSTGYSWWEEHSAAWLQMLEKGYTPDHAPTGTPIIVGGGGVDNFKFKALDKGAAIIVMRYARTSGGVPGEQKVFLVVAR